MLDESPGSTPGDLRMLAALAADRERADHDAEIARGVQFLVSDDRVVQVQMTTLELGRWAASRRSPSLAVARGRRCGIREAQ